MNVNIALVLVTFILVIITGYYAYMTQKMAKEMEKQSKLMKTQTDDITKQANIMSRDFELLTRPYMRIGTFKPIRDHKNKKFGVEFNIANEGKVPANCLVTVTFDGKQFDYVNDFPKIIAPMRWHLYQSEIREVSSLDGELKISIEYNWDEEREKNKAYRIYKIQGEKIELIDEKL